MRRSLGRMRLAFVQIYELVPENRNLTLDRSTCRECVVAGHRGQVARVIQGLNADVAAAADLKAIDAAI